SSFGRAETSARGPLFRWARRLLSCMVCADYSQRWQSAASNQPHHALQNITQKRELTRFAFRIVKRRAAVCARGRNGSIESNTDEFLTNFNSRTGGADRGRLPLLSDGRGRHPRS